MYIVRVTNSAASPPAALAPVPLPPSNCSDMCGNVSIPYPFGVGKGCYLDLPGYGNFSIICDNSTGHPTPLLGKNIFVRNITLETAEMVIATNVSVTHVCAVRDDANNYSTSTSSMLLHVVSPYLLSPTRNMFTAVGCDATAKLSGKAWNGTNVIKYKSGCITYCASPSDAAADGAPCKGLGCCEASITPGLSDISTRWNNPKKTSRVWEYNPCQYAFLAKDWYSFKQHHITAGALDNTSESSTPVVLDWAIRNGSCPPKTKNDGPFGACLSNYSKCANATSGQNGYFCICSDGYNGNPYIPNGCIGKTTRYDGNNSLPINFMGAYLTESKAYEMYDREIISTEEDKKCVENVGRIVVHCLEDKMDHRPAMTEVVKDLHMVRSAWLQSHGQMEH